jgi:4-carboxymuconolactone decarboxylase
VYSTRRGTGAGSTAAITEEFIVSRDLWLRPDLALRDRSLVTISALIANAQVAQLTGHIPIGIPQAALRVVALYG